MGHNGETDGHQRLQLGWLIAVVLGVVLVVGYLVACMIAQSLDGTRGPWWWLWSYEFEDQGSWFDVARTTAALVAIPGAAVALAITYARHHATERQIEQTAAESRALEGRELARRVNEQYVQAVDQLRDDSAVARIAGMHALDRLAQEQGDLRSIVVDVWCAYLRIERRSESGAMEADEREVRATCTRLLLSHLDMDDEAGYWADDSAVRVDLSRADLTAYWDGSHRVFPPGTRFTGATFGDNVWFDDAIFGRGTLFDGVTFGRNVWFDNAIFGDSVWFDEATFGTVVRFCGTQFGESACFDDAKFGPAANFEGAQFGDNAQFENVVFHDPAWFANARFGAHTPRGDGTWWLNERSDLDEARGQEGAEEDTVVS